MMDEETEEWFEEMCEEIGISEERKGKKSKEKTVD